MRQLRFLSVLLPLALLALTPAPAAAAPTALVVDDLRRAVVRVELPALREVARGNLPQAPHEAVPSPDGSRLAVVHRGTGSVSWFAETYQPETPAQLYVVDAVTLEVAHAVALGWGTPAVAWDAGGGGLVAFTPGYTPQRKGVAVAAELVAVDAASGAARRLDLGRPAHAFLPLPDGTAAAVFFAALSSKQASQPAELAFVDLQALAVTGRLTLPGAPQAPVTVRGDEHLYLVDPGQRGAFGALLVVSPAQRALVRTLPLGARPAVAAIDDAGGRLLLLAMEGKEVRLRDRRGLLHVMAGGESRATVRVPWQPALLRLSDDGSTAWVVGHSFLTEVDLANGAASPEVPVGTGAVALRVSDDASRAYVLQLAANDVCCVMTVVDVPARREVETVRTGSTGDRIFQALGAAAASYASYEVEKERAVERGRSTFYYTAYAPRVAAPAVAPLAVGADGAAFALDVQTDDVTVVGRDGTRLANLDAAEGGRWVEWLSPERRVLAAVGEKAVSLVDAASRTLVATIPFRHRAHDLVTAPEHGLALFYGTEEVVAVDAASGRTLARRDGFGSVAQVVVE
jgi:DNA-binding beta-propeller fold protein YncE